MDNAIRSGRYIARSVVADGSPVLEMKAVTKPSRRRRSAFDDIDYAIPSRKGVDRRRQPLQVASFEL
jgi:hypothetical protein